MHRILCDYTYSDRDEFEDYRIRHLRDGWVLRNYYQRKRSTEITAVWEIDRPCSPRPPM